MADSTASAATAGTAPAAPKRRAPRTRKPAAAPQVAPPTTLLQRIILPRTGDPLDVRALYLDEESRRTARALSRTSVRLAAQSQTSFATYFNAFPASYWRRWTTLDTVHLRLDLEGSGRVDVYRSKADGTRIHVRGELLETAGRHALDLALDLRPFEDGGWYWFDVTTDADEVVVHSGGWHAPHAAPGRAALTIGTPTFNRPADCVATLAALGEDELVRSVITAVVIPDQGTRKVRDQEGFAAAAAVLGDRLRVIDQANLGGSGGYARIMHEALTSTDCEQILFMDDDIALEPDSVLRALAFSRFARQPMLVGGQMLSLQARSHLHSMGEVVDRGVFRWRTAPHCENDHDLAEEPLRETDWMHRRTDVDYNAWWMCLIPRAVAEDVGLPLPLFIKFDDCEYGLRAGEKGYPTATVPGIAIWHMSFADKDDATDWQAYFHLRNRLVAAALHLGDAAPRAMLQDSFKHTLKHLISLEYSTAALQLLAIEHVLAGPDGLFDLLPTALGQVRALRAEYDDGRVLASASEVPLPSMGALAAQRFLDPPVKKVAIGATLARGLLHNLRAPKPEHHERPQLNIPAQDARWFLLSRLDGATVSTADGTGAAFRRRDPALFWKMLREAVAAHRELARRWPELHRRYREAAPQLTGPEAWKQVFSA